MGMMACYKEKSPIHVHSLRQRHNLSIHTPLAFADLSDRKGHIEVTDIPLSPLRLAGAVLDRVDSLGVVQPTLDELEGLVDQARAC